MNYIKITADREEMISIAKKIVAEKPEKYPEKILNMLKNTVRGRLPDASEKEVEDVTYITIYHYWVYGNSVDEYFYYRFYEKDHEDKNSYITHRNRVVYLEPVNKTEDKHILFNKYETYCLFKEFFKRDVIQCSSKDDYEMFRDFVEKHPVFVVKPTDMGGGRGVHKTSVEGLSDSDIKKLFNELLKESDINREKYLRKTESSVVFEELIDQADEMAVFNPESANGVRITTVRTGDKVVIYEPWLKIGRGGHFLTSAVFGTAIAGINPETGIVDTPGMTETGEVWEYHPDVNIKIEGFKIPKWDELVDMATKAALMLPTIGYVGWDFVLSKKGWCMMEGNFRGDFMWQLFRGRGMKKDFEELINWKMDKEFWWMY